MKGAFISPEIYAEIFYSQKMSEKKRAEFVSQLERQFRQSPYREILIPASWAPVVPPSWPAQILVFVARPRELQSIQRPQGSRLVVLTDQLRELKGILNQSHGADEIVFWARTSPNKVDLTILPKDPRLRWIFSYDISHPALAELLAKIKAAGLCLKASDYLEISPARSVGPWFAPTLHHKKVNEPESVDMSVVVPFQDNYDEILYTLPQLILSLREEPHTELIVVNDSFHTERETELLTLLSSQTHPICYLRIERDLPRTRGDSQFRAGVVRNLAASFAQGSEIIFLDSDILVSSTLWTKIRKARLRHNGPLMPRRRFLRSDLNLASFDMEKLQVGFHTQLSWGGHWEDFYRNPKMNDSWKWTSTYCLSLPKDVFMQTGGFARSFSTYGFEDTDLGYRLFQKNLALQILDHDVFHLPYTESRSEYLSQFERRKKLLDTSFATFLRRALEPDLLSQFRHILS